MNEERAENRPKILVVEDEQVVALDVEATLEGMGYRVVGIAGTGKEALQMTQESCPDLVLMDIQLQGDPDGIVAAAEIRQRWQIPVVFVTAFAGAEVLVRARTAGAYGYVTKPFRTKELNATVAIALEQHRLTKQIFQEHGWLRTLLTGMSNGIIATDAQGNVKFLNPVAEKLTGWALQEALGRSIEEVYPLRAEDSGPLEMCQLRRVLAMNQPIGRERFLLERRSEGSVVVEDLASPIHNSQGQLVGAVTVMTDITERQQAERERDRLMVELERSNADLARFSYTVAHDLQTPVRTIKSFAELLTREVGGHLPERAIEYLAFLSGAASGMERLIQALLRYAQVGEAPVKREWVAVSEVLAEAQLSLAALRSETQAHIEAGELPRIYVDRTQFQQLLQNLLVNALQYRLAGQEPYVSVVGESTDESWTFSVTDRGQGISPEHLERVFAPLTRLHGADVPGSGLGLALCRTIVERHGGRIWAESAGPGHGTTIRFVLPRALGTSNEKADRAHC